MKVKKKEKDGEEEDRGRTLRKLTGNLAFYTMVHNIQYTILAPWMKRVLVGE